MNEQITQAQEATFEEWVQALIESCENELREEAAANSLIESWMVVANGVK